MRAEGGKRWKGQETSYKGLVAVSGRQFPELRAAVSLGGWRAQVG